MPVAGAGDWKRVKWGRLDGRRRFARVTATCDAATGVWTAVAVTPDEGEGTGEVSQLPGLLKAQTHFPAVLMGDGAYDTASCYDAAAHGVLLVAPPQHNAKKGLHPDRDVTLSHIAHHGTRQWKQRSGYHTRSLVESNIGAFKQVFGDGSKNHQGLAAVPAVGGQALSDGSKNHQGLVTTTADVNAGTSLYNYRFTNPVNGT